MPDLYAIAVNAFTHHVPFVFIAIPFSERLTPDVPYAFKNDLPVLHSSIERRRIVFRLKLAGILLFKCQYVTNVPISHMWVIDIRHWLDNTKTGPAVPRLKFKVKKLSEIIAYATAEAAGIPVEGPPKCWRRPKRKPCTGNLDIRMDESTEQIYWKFGSCNDEGVVTGWRGLLWDVLDHPERLC